MFQIATVRNYHDEEINLTTVAPAFIEGLSYEIDIFFSVTNLSFETVCDCASAYVECTM